MQALERETLPNLQQEQNIHISLIITEEKYRHSSKYQLKGNLLGPISSLHWCGPL
jgi:hypothetical protein